MSPVISNPMMLLKMAAFRSCMRLCRKLCLCNSKNASLLSRRLNGKTLPFVFQICSNNVSGCFYSTSKSGDALKDLADGILQSKMSSSVPSQDESRSDSAAGPDKQKESKWTGKNAWKIGLIFLGGWATMSSGVLLFIWGSPQKDLEGNEIKDEFSNLPTVQAYFKRAVREFRLYKQMIQNPSRDKLLPDSLQYPYVQPPYTLVLEMTGILVHPDWTYGTGWRFKKRHGVDYFLQQVGPPLFEVVIYTAEQGYNADPILNNLDPNGFVMYRLYRDATRYLDGHHVKDLSCLNRDLSKVIIVDWNPKSFKLQPENAFHVKKWPGTDDRDLIDLANFLRTLGLSGVDDVRKVLQYYQQFDDPLAAFRENQRLLQEKQEQQAKMIQDKEQKTMIGRLPSLFRR